MASRSEATVTCGDVLPVDDHLALLRIEEAQGEIDQRALAGARGTDQRHGAPGGNGQAHAFQHRVVRLVGEGDIVEFDLAALQLERLRVGGFDELRLAVDDAEHAACRRNAFLQAASAASRRS